MAAPTPTARSTPTGIPLFDGFSTKITLAADLDIEFWEKDVQPPAVDGGDAIDITTMHNTTWRTKNARSLVDLGDVQTTVAYDPLCYTSILSVVNVHTTITVTFPDGTTLAFFGFLRSFAPNAAAEGAQPEATVTIVPTNYDHTNHVEAAPVLTNVAGT
jgi:hypothetical protein